MPSYEQNPAFNNEPEFIRPPDDHPYWTDHVFLMQEYGFSREILVIIAETNQIQNGRLLSRIHQAIATIKKGCLTEEQVDGMGDSSEIYYTPDSYAGSYTPTYEPDYIANALLRPFKDYVSTPEHSDKHLLDRFMNKGDKEFDDVDFCTAFIAYHPDNRLWRGLRPNIDEDGVLIDAAGLLGARAGFIDERGKVQDTPF